MRTWSLELGAWSMGCGAGAGAYYGMACDGRATLRSAARPARGHRWAWTYMDMDVQLTNCAARWMHDASSAWRAAHRTIV